jgi:RNA polymerase sigma-70 factor (ECF subfamily)
MTSDGDRRLLEAAAGGDRDAFGLLIERHYPAIVQLIHGFLGTVDHATTEDLAQEVFLAAWRAASSFRGQATALTWLSRIATNACLDHWRRGRRHRMVRLDPDQTLDDRVSATEHSEARAMAREQVAEVREAMADLPAKQRAAILLRHFLDLSYVEIAEVLDTSIPAVESLLFRARRSLQRTLAAGEYERSPQVSREVDV